MIGAPGIIMPIELVGRIEGWHYNAKTGLHTKVVDQKNTIHADLKAIMRDNMASPTDFAIDDMFSHDGHEWGNTGHDTSDGDPAGEDGIIIWDRTNDKWLTMVTQNHSDPSGSYYRQWQGVLTNDYGVGSFVVNAPKIGKNLTSVAAFGYDYAFSSFLPLLGGITMAANDILTVNWKVTVG